MTISVIMATLNASRFLGQALDSIAAQTRPPEEIILVDGGSTDGTIEIAGRYPRTRLVPQKGLGLPGAWNTGLQAATGTCFAFLDSDDRWVPEKLQWQADRLTVEPSLQAVVGHVRYFLEPGCPRPLGFKPELLQGTYPAPMPGALLIRREAVDLVGPFDTRFPIACDIDWFARLRDRHIPIATLPEVLIHKRVHEGNLSLSPASKPSYSKELVQLLFEKRKRVITSRSLPPADSHNHE